MNAAADPNGRIDVTGKRTSSGKRYLVLAEGCSDDPYLGKTARGILNYGLTPAVAVVDSTRIGETERGVPFVSSPKDACRYRPTTAVVGIAPPGGSLSPTWRQLLKDCIACGLDVENGLHEFIGDDAELAELAARHGVELRDLRRPPLGIGVPVGENLRLRAKTVLTVGSDCAIGKMTVSLESSTRLRGDEGSNRFSCRLGKPGSLSPGGGSRSTASSQTSSRAQRKNWSSKAPDGAPNC